MEQAIQHFILTLASERGASQNTLAAYRTDLRQLQDYLERSEITSWTLVRPEHLSAFLEHLEEREYATTSIARKVAAVKSFFQHLCETGAIPSDPATTVRSPRVEKYLPHALGPEEVARLFAQPSVSTPAGLRDIAMLHVLHATGLRVSELVALSLADLDADLRTVRCRARNHQQRMLPLSTEADAALRVYLADGRHHLLRSDDQDAVFLNHHGERLTRQGFWLIMKGYARAAGIADITPHTLRHSFALDMIVRGMELRSVQELLGHANISTTQVYRHLQRARAGVAVAGEPGADGSRPESDAEVAEDERSPSLVSSRRDVVSDVLLPGAR